MTKNILVVRLSSLGDVVLATPVFASLRKHLPQARISVLTKSQYVEVFFNNPNVDEIITLGPKESLLLLSRRLREKKYDLCLDLHSNLRSHLIGWLLGIPVIRYKKDSYARYRLVYFKKKLPALARSVVDRYLETLAVLNIKDYERETRIYLKPEENKWATEVLQSQGWSAEDTVIGINPGAKWATKIWPFSNWLEFLKMFKGRKAKLLMFGDKQDLPLTENLVRAVGEYDVAPVNVAGDTSLRQLFSLVAACRLLITSDSGTMHVAQALNVPVLVLLGPTVPEFGFIRSGERDRVLNNNLSCRPCSLHGDDHCKRGDQLCLAGIKPDAVFNVMYKQLTEMGIRI